MENPFFVTLAQGAINDYNISIDCNAEVLMASITIRNLDESLKSRLRVQAAFHGRSMEDEARDILRTTLNRELTPQANLAAAIRARFAPLGGVDLPETPREPTRKPPDFGE